MATLFFSLLGNLTIVVCTLFWAVPALLLGWVPPRGTVTFWCARAWAWCLLWGCGLRVRVERDPAIGRGHYVFMANHQSLFDIPLLLATLPGQTRFLAKRSLFRIPLFGWAIAAGGFVPVDREDKSKAREMFATAIARAQSGVSLLVFPEQTRSLDGQLLPFQRGGFLLAMKAGLPIVPVGIRGTFGVQQKRSFLIHPGTVEVRYGAPIPTAEVDVRQKRDLVATTRARVAELAGLAPAAAGEAAPAMEREQPL